MYPYSCVFVCVRLSKPLDPERAKFPKLGSKFRYAGHTQQQTAGSADTDRPAPIIHRHAPTRLVTRHPTDTIDRTGNLSPLFSVVIAFVF